MCGPRPPLLWCQHGNCGICPGHSGHFTILAAGPIANRIGDPCPPLTQLCSHLNNTVTQHYKVCRNGQVRYSPEHGFSFDFTFPPSHFYQFQPPPQLHLAHSDKMNLALFKIKTQLSANFPPGGNTKRRIKIYVSCRMEGGYRNC